MRLFVAIEIPAEIRAELMAATRPLRGELPVARWVKSEALHLTLVFLGETDAALLDELRRELAGACEGYAPLRLDIGGIGAFPPRGRRRVVWAGIETEGDLGSLQADVADAVERAIGLEPERRPFRPHLTLARCKTPWPASAVQRLADHVGPRAASGFEAKHVALIESTLLPSGPRYTALATFPLGGGA